MIKLNIVKFLNYCSEEDKERQDQSRNAFHLQGQYLSISTVKNLTEGIKRDNI